MLYSSKDQLLTLKYEFDPTWIVTANFWNEKDEIIALRKHKRQSIKSLILLNGKKQQVTINNVIGQTKAKLFGRVGDKDELCTIDKLNLEVKQNSFPLDYENLWEKQQKNLYGYNKGLYEIDCSQKISKCIYKEKAQHLDIDFRQKITNIKEMDDMVWLYFSKQNYCNSWGLLDPEYSAIVEWLKNKDENCFQNLMVIGNRQIIVGRYNFRQNSQTLQLCDLRMKKKTLMSLGNSHQTFGTVYYKAEFIQNNTVLCVGQQSYLNNFIYTIDIRKPLQRKLKLPKFFNIKSMQCNTKKTQVAIVESRNVLYEKIEYRIYSLDI